MNFFLSLKLPRAIPVTSHETGMKGRAATPLVERRLAARQDGGCQKSRPIGRGISGARDPRHPIEPKGTLQIK